MGWGSSTRRGGGRKLRARPRNFVCLGFRREESGMSQEFCRDVPDPWRCSKSLCKKTSCASFVPYKHKLFSPDFPWTFLTLTPECPGIKKFLPTTGVAGKRTFWCGCPRFSEQTSMTRRVVERLYTKKYALIFLAPVIDFWGRNLELVAEPPLAWGSELSGRLQNEAAPEKF